MSISKRLVESWACEDSSVHPLAELIAWIDTLNAVVQASVVPMPLSSQSTWFHDTAEGSIRNQARTFFSITGLQYRAEGRVVSEQPIILQREIGFLAILCREMDGVIHFLMQAKIEPGNVNQVQISPTIQATRSNFTLKHGGTPPAYLDYLEHAERYQIIVDQVQSEQGSRFLGKRNRNIVVLVDEVVPEGPWHRWMTLGQIKQLLKHDNLVNMDSRTVLSCLPFYAGDDVPAELFRDTALHASLYRPEPTNWPTIFHPLNDAKMFDSTQRVLVPLSQLDDWVVTDDEIVCRGEADFKVLFCDISIEGREVRHWFQPLVAALGQAEFGLFTAVVDGVRKFLVRLAPEAGSFDVLELGPTLQKEPAERVDHMDAVGQLYLRKLERKEGVLVDVILSEEGGRFYHEQNRNSIIEIDPAELRTLREEYLWLDYKALNEAVQFSHCLNIQLRNLLSLLEL